MPKRDWNDDEIKYQFEFLDYKYELTEILESLYKLKKKLSKPLGNALVDSVRMDYIFSITAKIIMFESLVNMTQGIDETIKEKYKPLVEEE
jgi:hypothetical protein